MPISYQNFLRNGESLSRGEQLQLISALAEHLRVQVAREERTSILELQGLGQEIWQGMDAQDHVDRERASVGGGLA